MLGCQKGMTLIELVMVIIIIGILSGVAMKSMDSAILTGKIEGTKHELDALAEAIVGNPDIISNGFRVDFGYVGDVGALPGTLDALVANPGGYSTWNGPYIKNNFTQANDDYKKDAWNILYTYSGDVTITSTGSGSNITKQLANAASDLTNSTIQGVVVDVEGIPPGTYSTDVNISINYPDGTGGTTTASTNPSSNGSYSFTGIPIGNHAITAVNAPTNDTLFAYVTVPPKSTVINNLRFGSALWGAGNASSGDQIQYVSGSAVIQGTYNVEFRIFNNTGENVALNWLKATYVRNPVAYFERVRWGNTSIAYSASPRYASDQQVNFSSSRTINDGTTVTIKMQGFNTALSGAGSGANMSGVSFTVLFSDSSLITFSL
jgi:prepilin-type N-terminal cleavage/methylation domain-containing protein